MLADQSSFQTYLLLHSQMPHMEKGLFLENQTLPNLQEIKPISLSTPARVQELSNLQLHTELLQQPDDLFQIF